MFLFVLFLIGTQPAPAEEFRELTLAECVRLAVSSNTGLAKGRLDRELAILDRRIGEDYFKPDLYLFPETDYRTSQDGRLRFTLASELVQRIPTGGTIQAGFNNRYNHYSGNSQPGDWTSRVSVKLSQPLLRGAGLEVGTSPVVLARLGDQEDLYKYQWQVTQTITLAQKRFWDLLLAQENLAVARQALDQSRRMLAEAEERGRPGEALDLESEVADNELDVYGRLLTEARANLRLLDLLDLPAVTKIRPKGEFDFRPVTVDLDGSLEAALEKRPDLRQAGIRAEMAEIGRAVALSNARQDLDLVVQASSQATEEAYGQAVKGAFDLSDEWLFFLGAEIRFGVPGRDREAVAAGHRLKKARMDLEELRQAVRNDTTTAVYSLTRSLKAIELASRSLGLAEKKLSAARERVARGEVDGLKLIIYQRDLTEARLKKFRVIVDYFYDLADLDEAMGSSLETWQVSIGP